MCSIKSQFQDLDLELNIWSNRFYAGFKSAITNYLFRWIKQLSSESLGDFGSDQKWSTDPEEEERFSQWRGGVPHSSEYRGFSPLEPHL